VSRDDVRLNLAGWEADADDYQARHSSQLNRWDRLGWGTYDVPEDEIHALGDVRDLDVLELGCGAAQCGIRVARMGARSVLGIDFSERQLAHARRNIAQTRSAMRLGYFGTAVSSRSTSRARSSRCSGATMTPRRPIGCAAAISGSVAESSPTGTA